MNSPPKEQIDTYATKINSIVERSIQLMLLAPMSDDVVATVSL
jgi:hypothetical protein